MQHPSAPAFFRTDSDAHWAQDCTTWATWNNAFVNEIKNPRNNATTVSNPEWIRLVWETSPIGLDLRIWLRTYFDRLVREQGTPLTYAELSGKVPSHRPTRDSSSNIPAFRSMELAPLPVEQSNDQPILLNPINNQQDPAGSQSNSTNNHANPNIPSGSGVGGRQ
jgi:hypothetical protein